MQVHLRELLETRLQLTQAWSGRPEILDASAIERPIFITVMPRSGSTFLHELLAEDPENRGRTDAALGLGPGAVSRASFQSDARESGTRCIR